MVFGQTVAKKKPIRDKERSRRKFIEATIKVLRRDGPSGLTTGRIAKMAGLSQPSFYMHFTDMDDALRVVSEEVETGIRRAFHESRLQVTVGNDPLAIRRTYEVAVTELMAQPEFTDLFLRHMNDSSSALGKRMAESRLAFHEDLVADLDQMGMREVVGDLDLYARFIVGLTLATVDGLLVGLIEDKDRAVDALTRTTLAMGRAFAELEAEDRGRRSSPVRKKKKKRKTS